MAGNSSDDTKKKSAFVGNQKMLGDTMSQLKDALDRWQTVQPEAPSETAKPEIEPDWLAETRDLLQELNDQLNDLSK